MRRNEPRTNWLFCDFGGSNLTIFPENFKARYPTPPVISKPATIQSNMTILGS